MEGRSLARGALLLFALSLVRLGLGRIQNRPGFVPQGDSALSQLAVESREAGDEQRRRTTPLRPGEVLDPNRSPEEELDRLPGVGPATARAIVSYREENGGFSGPEDLMAVPGIGPSKLENLRPHLDFSSGIPLELYRERRDRSQVGRGGRLPPGGRNLPANQPGVTPAGGLDLNRATRDELKSLPGIGPALADRILQNRRTEGPFRSVDDLIRVKGIGPSTVTKIRSLVSPGG